VPNRVSITGHTDVTPYAGVSGYTNWDLSTDRANAARRALESAGYSTNQFSRVAGLGSSVLFNKENPRDPVNRRLSIVVMTQAAEEQAQRIDIPTASTGEPAADAATPGIEGMQDEAPAPDIPVPAQPPVASAAPARR
jgi:chemotaxis protein MotB